MRLVNYIYQAEQRSGALFQDWLVDLDKAAGYLLDKTGDPAYSALSGLEKVDWFVHADKDTKTLAHQVLVELHARLQAEYSELLNQAILIPDAEIEYLPPVCHPGKIIGVGLNYPDVSIDKTTPPPTYPVLFLKPPSALTGYGQPILLPHASRQVLFEGELAVVIGRIGKHIPPQQALSHVAGYTIANDVGARDLEQRTSQWTSGKISDTFCPIGPAMVTLDEISDPHHLKIRARLNGEIVQEGNTAQMHFDIPTLISYISELTTLEPGDLILTGSPKGIGASHAPAIPMQSGDTIAIEIESLGVLMNFAMAEEHSDER